MANFLTPSYSEHVRSSLNPENSPIHLSIVLTFMFFRGDPPTRYEVLTASRG
jgi:hypothetical protein